MAFRNSPLRAFLEFEASEPDDGRFVARNFLLDERVPNYREDHYLESFTDLPSLQRCEWLATHADYLDEFIFVSPSESQPHPPPVIGQASGSRCAETFQQRPGYLGMELTLSDELLRIEPLVSLQGAFSATEDDRDAFADYVETLRAGNVPGPTVRDHVDAVMRSWTRDLRPWFAAPRTDVEEHLASSNPSWADDLRDALGLLHYDPDDWTMPIDIVVYRYSVAELPRIASGGIAVAAPSVLDGRPSYAFCPSPTTEGEKGRAVSLAPPLDAPVREVIHAPFQLRAAHIWRIGRIVTTPSVPLASCRRSHLEWLRGLAASMHYAGETDADLLGIQ